MIKEEKKIIKTGDTGNVAKISKSTIDRESLDLGQRNGFRRLGQAGSSICPHGAEYLGSAAIHYYKEKGGSVTNPVFKVATQIALAGVEEGMADFGHKRLREAMMEGYGRKVPEIRQDLVVKE